MDYQPNPVVLRQVSGVTITQSGHSVDVDGKYATLIMLADVNAAHFMRSFVERNAAKLKAANAVALVLGQVDGKSAQVVLTAEQFALGAAERARYTAWCKGDVAARSAAADEYDRKYNDGERGDNPHRGPHRLGGAFDRRERHYPDGA